MKKNRKIIVGNWKMGPTSPSEAIKIFTETLTSAAKFKKVLPIVCPPAIYLQKIAELAKKKIAVGAQDVFQELQGSFTGEISAEMLKKLGVTYVIIGHSEQRKLGETDEIINKKVHAVQKLGLVPIICVGEDVRDEEGHYMNAIKFQLEHALLGVPKSRLGSVIIAYEPVWKIGAETAMDSHSVHEMMIFIKRALVDLYKIRPPLPAPILYGGAVDPMNAHNILKEGEADGLLIGRQSLSPESFTGILRIAQGLKK